MLELFRSGKTSIVTKILLGILVASFALWGVGSDILGGAGSTVAKIGKANVSVQDYADAFQRGYGDLQRQNPTQEMTRLDAIKQGYGQRWLERLVQQKALYTEAKNLGIRVTDEQLRAYITGLEAFKNDFGTFDRYRVESMAQSQGLSLSEFEELIREDMVRQYLITSLVENVSVPSELQKTLVKFMKEERSAEILSIPASSITDIAEATDEDYQDYYNRNANIYMAPEYRDISYITITADDFSNAITISEEEMQAEFDVRNVASEKAESRDVEWLNLDDKTAADTVFSALESGKTFHEVIQENSDNSVEDATIMALVKNDAIETYGQAAADIIFSANEGGYTPPLETDFGWFIFKVNKSHRTEIKFEDLRDEIRTALEKLKAEELIYELSGKIEDQLAEGASLPDLASNLGLKLINIEAIDRNGITPKGIMSPDVPPYSEFLSKIYEAFIDEEPVLEQAEDGAYYLYSINSITESKLRDFEEVKDSVMEGWKNEARHQKSQEIATSIKTAMEAEEGISLKDQAASHTEAAFNEITLRRDDFSGKISPVLQQSIFDQDIGSLRISPAADGNGTVIIKVVGSKIPEGPFPILEDENFTNQIKNDYQQTILSNYMRHLEVSLPITMNSLAVKAVQDQLTAAE